MPVRRGRALWPGLLLLWVVALLVGINTRPLIPVDELRYAAVAWEMWVRGDFLVPYLNGEPYSHKPPLFFWLIHAGWWLFGVNEWSMRLLAPLLTLLVLLATAHLAGQLWPGDTVTRRLSAPVQFACVFLVAFFTWLQIDMLLVLLTVLAMVGVIDAARGGRAGWLLTGIALGLGILAKGPIILIHVLPPALLAPWWHSGGPAGGNWRWYGGLLAALVLAAVIALAWALPAAAAGGEAYGRAILWGQTAGRVVQSFAHAHPVWWYIPWLFVLFAPWILLPWLWGAVRKAWSARDDGLRFCITWLVTVLLLLSLISGKQLKYLLPVLPAFSLLVARVLAQLDSRPVQQRPWLLMIVLAIIGLGGVVAPFWLAQAPWLNSVHPGWGLGLLVAAAVLWWSRPARPQHYPMRMVMISVFAVCIGQLGVLRIGAPAYDMHASSQVIADIQAAGHTVAVESRYHGEFTFPGRLRQPVVQLAPCTAADWARRHPEDYLVQTGKHLPVDYPQADYNRPLRSGRLVIVRGRARIPYNGARGYVPGDRNCPKNTNDADLSEH